MKSWRCSASGFSLSDEQKSQILPIITERQQKIQTIRNDASLPPQQRMSQAQKHHEGQQYAQDQPLALLTPEQQQGYSQIEQSMRRMRPYHQQGSAAQ